MRPGPNLAHIFIYSQNRTKNVVHKKGLSFSTSIVTSDLKQTICPFSTTNTGHSSKACSKRRATAVPNSNEIVISI